MSIKPLKIEGTEFTPYIYLKSGCMQIEGRAILEDSIDFFSPILKWTEEYIKNPEDKTVLKINLQVYDSSVNRRFIELFNLLEKITTQNKKVYVYWFYDPDDSISLQKGYEFASVYNLDFRFIPQRFDNTNDYDIKC